MGWGRLMGWGHRIAMVVVVLPGLVLSGCDDPTPKADPEALSPHVPRTYPGPCLIQTDLGNDGTYDSTSRLGYDLLGRTTLWERLDDEHVKHRKECSYDSRDRPSECDERWNTRFPDGHISPDSWTRHQYGYEGDNRVRHAGDIDRDGSIDWTWTARWDADGRLVEERLEHAHPALEDYVWRWTYDADGNEILFVEEERLRDAVILRTLTHRYVGWLAVEAFLEEDGILQWRREADTNADGRVTEARRDNDGDGVVDWRAVYTYSTNGLERTSKTDADGDGDFDEVRVEIQDGAGRKEVRLDKDANGDLDYIEVNTLSETETSTLYDYDGDGVVDRSRVTTLTDFQSGRMPLLEVWDNDGDGVVDVTTTWRYGPHGLEEMRSANAAGMEVDFERVTYDAVGNRLLQRTPQMSRKYSYICPWSPFER